ncbi:MAG: hypothetical protein JNK24_05980 [Alphaproteobacteria bacterium]|nr:hypothetical protein [Alphaproteobacteria bacterium]
MKLRNIFMAVMLSFQSLAPVGSALADNASKVLMDDEVGECTIKTSVDGKKFESTTQGNITHRECVNGFQSKVTEMEQKSQFDNLSESERLERFRTLLSGDSSGDSKDRGIVVMIFASSATNVSIGNGLEIKDQAFRACRLSKINISLSEQQERGLLGGCPHLQ